MDATTDGLRRLDCDVVSLVAPLLIGHRFHITAPHASSSSPPPPPLHVLHLRSSSHTRPSSFHGSSWTVCLCCLFSILASSPLRVGFDVFSRLDKRILAPKGGSKSPAHGRWRPTHSRPTWLRKRGGGRGHRCARDGLSAQSTHPGVERSHTGTSACAHRSDLARGRLVHALEKKLPWRDPAPLFFPRGLLLRQGSKRGVPIPCAWRTRPRAPRLFARAIAALASDRARLPSPEVLWKRLVRAHVDPRPPKASVHAVEKKLSTWDVGSLWRWRTAARGGSDAHHWRWRCWCWRWRCCWRTGKNVRTANRTVDANVETEKQENDRWCSNARRHGEPCFTKQNSPSPAVQPCPGCACTWPIRKRNSKKKSHAIVGRGAACIGETPPVGCVSIPRDKSTSS